MTKLFTKMTQSFYKKIVVGTMAALLMLGAAVPAQAQSQSQIDALLAQIAALQAQIGALMGGQNSGAACYAYTRDLTIGSTGHDVVQVQTFLQAKAFLIMPTGVAMGYFGGLTQSALARWQASVGVAPAAGYFGPITRAKIKAFCVVVPPSDNDDDNDNDSDLEGGAGSIEDADFSSGLSNEEVGEDDEDVEVAGLEIEADGSDIEVTALTLTFDETDGDTTSDFEDYATEVSVWFDGEEVARVDAEEFEDDDWSSTISLDDGVIIREGDTEEITIAISGQNNIDGSDLGDEWDIEFESVRFRDAQNAVVTDSSTGDIGGATRTFSFESFSTASNVEFHISNGDDEINDAHTVTIDEDQNTDDVEVLSFMMEAQGDSDLEIKNFGINLAVTGESHVDDVVAGGSNPAIRLIIDGEEYGDAEYEDDGDGVDVGPSEDVLFEDVDYVLEAGDEVEVLIVVDLLSINDGLGIGSTISASVGESETDQTTLVEIEDESGEELTDNDMTGSATAEDITLFENGIMVEAVSTDANANDGDTVGTFKVVVDITAFGDDQYIYNGAHTASSSSAGFNYTIFEGGSASSTFFGSASDLVQSTADTTGSYFRINEGETERFTLTVTLDPSASTRLYNIELDAVRFDPDNAADGASTDDNTYNVPNSEDVETDALSLKAS